MTKDLLKMYLATLMAQRLSLQSRLNWLNSYLLTAAMCEERFATKAQVEALTQEIERVNLLIIGEN